MSMKNLDAETLDIHTGGSDLIFPHHTNEIAQSEAVTGKKFVNYWMHGGFITVDGKKMSKSLGNIFTLEDLRKKNIDPLSYRYFVLGAHYSTLLNFTWESVLGAQTALRKLREKVSSLLDNGNVVETNFNQFINDDLNTPKVLALIWDILRDEKITEADKKATILDFDKVLGLKLQEKVVFEMPEKVKDLLKERDEARFQKDFEKSDRLRKEIENLGFEVKDTERGTEINPN
jgi:cysteinyl-tRNA synthetase